jgi:hypothetical protein
MKHKISECLVESVFDSIVNTAEKEGVESRELFALLQDRFHQTKQQEMPRNKNFEQAMLQKHHGGTCFEMN